MHPSFEKHEMEKYWLNVITCENVYANNISNLYSNKKNPVEFLRCGNYNEDKKFFEY